MTRPMHRAEWLSFMDGDEELLAEVAGLFASGYPKLRASLGQALASQDAPLLARIAHTLHGSICNFPAPGAEGAAKRLEELGRQGDLRSAEEALGDLDREMAALLGVLREFTHAPAGEEPCVS